MRYLLTIGLLFLIYLIGCGGGNDGGTNNPATATGSISGYLSAPSIDQTDMQVTSRQPNSAQQPIANATVTLTDLHQSMKTDPSGFFSFVSVPVGTHQLKISHPQFRDALTMPVTVTANGVTQVETQLGVGYYISIGAGDYLYLPDSADLPNTPINAQRIATSIFHSFYGQGTLLTNTNATKQKIRDTILSTTSRMAKNDFLVIFYSGHGDSRLENGSKFDAICPTDLVYDDLSTYITDTELRDWLLTAPVPSHVIVIMDTCFSGAFADGSTTLTRHATTPLALYALKSIGCTVLASSATDELSWEIDGLGNFTRYLDLGLGNDKAQADTNRDHQVTAQELYNYAAPRTTAAEPTQHPTLQVGDNPVLIRY